MLGNAIDSKFMCADKWYLYHTEIHGQAVQMVVACLRAEIAN